MTVTDAYDHDDGDPAGWAASDDTVVPQYPSLDDWVRHWFAPVMRRRVRGQMHWCERWWAHPEAAARLGSLWSAWEQAEVEGGGGPSQWWLYHLEGHWPFLSGPTGPFAACQPGRHVDDPEPLPTTAVPPDHP